MREWTSYLDFNLENVTRQSIHHAFPELNVDKLPPSCTNQVNLTNGTQCLKCLKDWRTDIKHMNLPKSCIPQAFMCRDVEDTGAIMRWSGIVTVASSLALFALYWRIKGMRRHPARLLLARSVMELVQVTSAFVSIEYVDCCSKQGAALGAVMQFVLLGIELCFLFIMIDVVLGLNNPFRSPQTSARTYLAITLLCSGVSSIVLLLTHRYGPDGHFGLCWVLNTGSQHLNTEKWALGYVPIGIVVLATAILTGVAFRMLRRRRFVRRSLRERDRLQLSLLVVSFVYCLYMITAMALFGIGYIAYPNMTLYWFFGFLVGARGMLTLFIFITLGEKAFRLYWRRVRARARHIGLLRALWQSESTLAAAIREIKEQRPPPRTSVSRTNKTESVVTADSLADTVDDIDDNDDDEDGGDADSAMEPHVNIWLRDEIEMFTQAGIGHLAKVCSANAKNGLLGIAERTCTRAVFAVTDMPTKLEVEREGHVAIMAELIMEEASDFGSEAGRVGTGRGHSWHRRSDGDDRGEQRLLRSLSAHFAVRSSDRSDRGSVELSASSTGDAASRREDAGRLEAGLLVNDFLNPAPLGATPPSAGRSSLVNSFRGKQWASAAHVGEARDARGKGAAADSEASAGSWGGRDHHRLSVTPGAEHRSGDRVDGGDGGDGDGDGEGEGDGDSQVEEKGVVEQAGSGSASPERADRSSSSPEGAGGESEEGTDTASDEGRPALSTDMLEGDEDVEGGPGPHDPDTPSARLAEEAKRSGTVFGMHSEVPRKDQVATVTEYCPGKFFALRHLFGYDPEEYADTVSRIGAGRIIGGRSGAFFFVTHDRRLIMKTISRADHGVLLDVLDDYLHHVLESALPEDALGGSGGKYATDPEAIMHRLRAGAQHADGGRARGASLDHRASVAGAAVDPANSGSARDSGDGVTFPGDGDDEDDDDDDEAGEAVSGLGARETPTDDLLGLSRLLPGMCDSVSRGLGGGGASSRRQQGIRNFVARSATYSPRYSRAEAAAVLDEILHGASNSGAWARQGSRTGSMRDRLRHPRTIINRFLGCYSIKVWGRTLYFIVVENAFPPDSPVHEQYDLKGSTVARTAQPVRQGMDAVCRKCQQEFVVGRASSCPFGRQHIPSQLLKDNDWRSKILLPARTHKYLKEQLRQDVGWLRAHGIMDYSLLVGVQRQRYPVSAQRRAPHGGGDGKDPDDGQWRIKPLIVEGPATYNICIIDMLQRWTVDKQSEHFMKTVFMCKPRMAISAVEPALYAERFLSFVEHDVLEKMAAHVHVMAPGQSFALDVSGLRTYEGFLAAIAVRMPKGTGPRSLMIVADGGAPVTAATYPRHRMYWRRATSEMPRVSVAAGTGDRGKVRRRGNGRS